VRVARRILFVGTIAWLGVAGAALLAAVAGRDALLGALPPLAIDADALGGALTAVAVASAGIGALHAWLVGALAGRDRRPLTVGTLLACVLTAVFVALAAASAASAIRETAIGPWLWLGCAASAAVAIGYAWSAADLIGQLRSRAPN
jgi:hypothetical protein